MSWLAARLWLGVFILAVLVRLPVLVTDTVVAVGATAPVVASGITEAPVERIRRVTAISPELVAAVREALPENGLPEDGRLVLFSPYEGTGFEFTLRLQFERTKNLLYPDPRDVRFASGVEALRDEVTEELVGRLLVLDGTQSAAPLTVGGRYELVHTERLGDAAMLRLWRLVAVD